MVSISHIGEGASALTCHTELTTCCREQDNPSGGALGEWTGPDTNQIPESSTTSGFYVSRQRSSISLNRGGHSTVGGQYCCVIPRTGGEMTFCVQVQMGGKQMIHRSTEESEFFSAMMCSYVWLNCLSSTNKLHTAFTTPCTYPIHTGLQQVFKGYINVP